jgi:glutaminase
MKQHTFPDGVDSPVQSYLEQLHSRLSSLIEGSVATYIPELANVDPNAFGIVIATVDGHLYEVGDSQVPFTIQSVSKPLAYGLALEDQGADRVSRAVGVEPSGEAFNSISLEPGTGRPMNPMINAGAIAVASLIAGDSPQERLDRLLSTLSAYAGRPLKIDQAVFASERDTGHRNRAISHLLRNSGIVEGDPEAPLDLYFNQCSVEVTCRDLALMAATLAGGGINPVSGQRAVSASTIPSILSVMTTCGVYDFTGEWVHRVGLPAKSGVGGGILAVLPGQVGIGVFSPRLDARGNSVRGVAVCAALSAELGLHFLQPPRVALATVRASYSLTQMRSRRRRPPAEAEVLAQHGHCVRVIELQGDLSFATLEPVLRTLHEGMGACSFLVLDFKRVPQANAAATRMLARLVGIVAARGGHVVFSRVRRGELLAELGGEVDPRHAGAFSFHSQLDLGIEACERSLLAWQGVQRAAPQLQSLADHQLCAGIPAEELLALDELLLRRSLSAGQTLMHSGDAADSLVLLMRGELSVVVALPQGGSRRLATLSAGMSLGESALVRGGRRSADVVADTEVEVLMLTVSAFDALQLRCPSLALRLLRRMLANSIETVTRLTGEVAALES